MWRSEWDWPRPVHFCVGTPTTDRQTFIRMAPPMPSFAGRQGKVGPSLQFCQLVPLVMTNSLRTGKYLPFSDKPSFYTVQSFIHWSMLHLSFIASPPLRWPRWPPPRAPQRRHPRPPRRVPLPRCLGDGRVQGQPRCPRAAMKFDAYPLVICYIAI